MSGKLGEMPEPDRTAHISVSRLNTWHRCPKQYEFRYIEGIKTPPALRPTAGKAGHRGLEEHMRNKIETGIDWPDDSLMQDYFTTEFHRESEGMELELGEDIEQSKTYIRAILSRYRDTVAPFVQPKAVEVEFLLKLHSEAMELPPVKGYVDVLKVPLDGPPTLDADDYKFKFPDKRGYRPYPFNQDDIDWSDQMTQYDMTFLSAGIRVDRVGLITLIGPSPREPTPSIVPIYRSPELMQEPFRTRMHKRLVTKYETMVKMIKHGTFLPTNNPRTCSWCGYRKICPDSLAKNDFLAQQLRTEGGPA